MGSVENNLGGNATYLLKDLWSNHRGTVLRIEALALLAIGLSFFLAAFGSCRRWSNRWIIQKGFLAAQALSLSLGTYSIGLMQSSPVKSKMYPIWTVSLLTLFGCIDPVSTYNSLDYKGPLSKLIFQLCLYLGYVLLMTVSTSSSDVGKIAIGILSTITFMKGFHRSLAFVLPSRMRSRMVLFESAAEPNALAGDGSRLQVLLFGFTYYARTWNMRMRSLSTVYMDDIQSSYNIMLDKLQLKEATGDGVTIEDVCLGYSLSHSLQQRFLGLDKATQLEKKGENFESLILSGQPIDYRRAMKAVEVELAFLFEVFFTSNEFLHHYEAKTSSFWALASFLGICFVGAVAALPAGTGTMASGRRRSTYAGPGAGTFFVDTTTADLIITLVILVSLSLLQLVQLIRCWTSNWARLAFACEFAACRPGSTTARSATTVGIFAGDKSIKREKGPSWWRWMRLKGFVVTRMNWFDKYLWQDQLGQYSPVDATRIRKKEWPLDKLPPFAIKCLVYLYYTKTKVSAMCLCDRLPGVLGMQYIQQVLQELWVDTKTGAPFRLHDDVKASVADFLGQIKSRRIGKDWSSLFVDNGLDAEHLPYSTAPLQVYGATRSDAYAFMHRVMMWQITTCYCELAEKEEGSAGNGGGERGVESHVTHNGEDADREEEKKKKNRRVAIALSKYCAYLAASALELLPGPTMDTNAAFKEAVRQTRFAVRVRGARNKMEAMRRSAGDGDAAAAAAAAPPSAENVVKMGVYWGKRLLNETPPPAGCTPRRRSDDRWEVLARLWVQTLLYAAPCGDVQRHMQHLSQGGQFITHLWALLYHLGIDRWEIASIDELKAAPAAETTEVQAQAGESEIEEIGGIREEEAAAGETREAGAAAGESKEVGAAQEAREEEIIEEAAIGA